MSWEQLRRTIAPLDQAARDAALARQDTLTKPPGSLGRLEPLGAQLAGIAGECPPPVPQRPAVLVFAGDHGVAARGVSAYPSEVTAQMVLNFLHGGAAINVLSRQAGATVRVVDAGVAADLPSHEGLLAGKIARGTADLSRGPAMTTAQAGAALELGVAAAQAQLAAGADLLACGDMGIANTTPSAAIVAAVTGRPPAEVTGYGTGLAPASLGHKVAVIAEALAVNQPDPRDGLDLLAKLGGFEIGAIAGAMLAAGAARVPVVVDGLIATAGAMLACLLAPNLTGRLIAGHASVEPGHRAALAWLGLEPLLDLGLRLGEGTGAVLAFGLVQSAARILNEMATFAEAGVSGR